MAVFHSAASAASTQEPWALPYQAGSSEIQLLHLLDDSILQRPQTNGAAPGLEQLRVVLTSNWTTMGLDADRHIYPL